MSENNRQIEGTAAAWLASRDAGNWTGQERAAFEAWLDEDLAHRVAFLRLNATWNEAGRLATLGAGGEHDVVPARGGWARSRYFDDPANDPVRKIGRRSRRTHQARRSPWAVGVAATLFLAVVVASSLVWRSAHHVERGAWQTAVGAQQVVHLGDGSTATLSSDTELQTALSRHERDLQLLHGEAFFEVAEDHTRPFVVHVNGSRVIAVGTRFSVRRDGASKLRVVVTRGLVQLRSTHNSGQLVEELPAGSVATIDGDRVAVRHVTLDRAHEYLSWRKGYVVFHDTPLAQAVAEFNRYNQHKIVIADPSLDDLRIGGNFRVDNSAAFVRLLQKVLPVRARQGDHYLALSRRESTSTTH